ncbi:hypothetical protein ACJD0Z_00480 [Flavobacteriaceae bacterium M23B6Z8]
MRQLSLQNYVTSSDLPEAVVSRSDEVLIFKRVLDTPDSIRDGFARILRELTNITNK